MIGISVYTLIYSPRLDFVRLSCKQFSVYSTSFVELVSSTFPLHPTCLRHTFSNKPKDSSGQPSPASSVNTVRDMKRSMTADKDPLLPNSTRTSMTSNRSGDHSLADCEYLDRCSQLTQ